LHFNKCHDVGATLKGFKTMKHNTLVAAALLTFVLTVETATINRQRIDFCLQFTSKFSLRHLRQKILIPNLFNDAIRDTPSDIDPIMTGK
jgi:hypothetical protein